MLINTVHTKNKGHDSNQVSESIPEQPEQNYIKYQRLHYKKREKDFWPSSFIISIITPFEFKWWWKPKKWITLTISYTKCTFLNRTSKLADMEENQV